MRRISGAVLRSPAAGISVLVVVLCLLFSAGSARAAMPIVTVDSSTEIEETTATLHGAITDTGGTLCDSRGFVWDTTSRINPGNVSPGTSSYTFNWTEAGTFDVGAFSRPVDSLTPGLLYYVRACAINVDGWFYSDEVSFRTKPEAPANFIVGNPALTTLDLSWTKDVSATQTYIVRKPASYPASRADGAMVYNGTGNVFQDSGLEQGIAYYYRAWSWAPDIFSDGYVQGNSTTLAIPVIDAVTPVAVYRGDDHRVMTITGTKFRNASSVSLGDGIVVADFSVDSDVQITAHINVTWDAGLGNRTASIIGTGGTGTKVNALTVNAPVPLVTACSPATINRGEGLKPVTITGTGFVGATTVTFGAGIVVDDFVANAYNQITCHITAAPDAALGARNVVVTTPGGSGTGSGIISVGAPVPIVSSITPNTGKQGDTTSVTISGAGLLGATSISFGSAITVSSFTVQSDAAILCNITIGSAAALGFRDVSVTTTGGTGTKTSAFEVTTDYYIHDVAPGSGSRGQSLSVTINGAGFLGVSSVTFDSGITVASFTVVSDLRIDCNISIPWSAIAGNASVNIIKAQASASLANAFIVNLPVPTIQACSLSSARQGDSYATIIITGTGFLDTSMMSFGDGITVGSFTVDSPSQITASITVALEAVVGSRDLSVTTAGGIGTKTQVLQITWRPTVTTITPNIAHRGDHLSLIVSGYQLGGFSLATFSKDVTVNSVMVSDIQVIIDITISASADYDPKGLSIVVGDVTINKPGALEVTPILSIASFSPGAGRQGETLAMTIKGTGFVDVTGIAFGSGITVSSFAVVSEEQINVQMTVDKKATIGAVDLNVMARRGTATLPRAFEIQKRPAPSLWARWGLALICLGIFGSVTGVIVWKKRRDNAPRKPAAVSQRGISSEEILRKQQESEERARRITGEEE